MKKQTQIPVTSYRAAGFIGKYQKIVHDTVIPYQYNVLWDRVSDAPKSHVVQNFINAARALRGEAAPDGFYGMVFQDSDAYKWLEAVAYSLANYPDRELEKKADELIDLIAEAQDSDGYLNTAFTIKDRDRRFTNLLEGHELYCSGHMFEAACAYYEVTGKKKLLEVAVKNAECLYRHFVTERHAGVPGHPEVELALLRLYRTTKNTRFLDLAGKFIDERGTDPDFFAKEAENRNWSVWNMNPMDHAYRQSGIPVREQTEATGHAVRAVYLFTGMADLASETEDRKLLEACQRLWKNIVTKRMYLTGGIGSTCQGEAFTVDYDLPPDTAYSETCAAIGLMFFAGRMLELECSGEYADIMELAFYNTVLAGMQLDGTRFFYVNPLEVNQGISGIAPTHSHVLSKRPGWYACACCPPNVARLIGSLGAYAYSENQSTAFCHLFAAGEVQFSNGMSLTCTTDYPYDMSITYSVHGSGTLAIRLPGFSKDFRLLQNGKRLAPIQKDGYLYVEIREQAELTLLLDGAPFFVRATNRIPRLTGMAALMRGPLVYCFEGADNATVTDLYIDRAAAPKVCDYDAGLLNGTVPLKAEAFRRTDCSSTYSTEPEAFTPCEAVAIPYYTWGNRTPGDMRVWMNVLRRP